jgi:hypothetical protein
MIAMIKLSVCDVVDSERERTVTGVLKCPSCGRGTKVICG